MNLSKTKQMSFRERLEAKIKERSGLGTLEIVIIIAVLLSVALLFREQLTGFANELMGKVFDGSVLDQIG